MKASDSHTKILLSEDDLPTHWYNIIPDLPHGPPPPPLHPATHAPITPADLAALFPPPLIEQEVSTERFIPIPPPVRAIYRQWRPTPLFRARRLERALNTPAHIYYKYEGGSPAGSHKPNTAVPQAYYNSVAGTDTLTTETGAGQWGSALAFACAQFDLRCRVWQVRASYDSKPYRRTMMRLWGAEVHPSPSQATDVGRAILADTPNTPGSLGIAISEAVEAAVQSERTKYALGSVLNHVLLHQTVIGEETLLQLAAVDATPDLVVGCTGGGSNFGGLVFPLLRQHWQERNNARFLCVEPTACPTLTRGQYRYDFGDTKGLTPLMKMHTLGHGFVPDAIHAGGLRYHGMSPLVSLLVDRRELDAVAIDQTECFEAARLFAKTEGIVAAPEPAHSLAAVLREAKRAKETGEETTIVTALCGHGHLDLPSYEKFLDGQLVDTSYPASNVEQGTEQVVEVQDPAL